MSMKFARAALVAALGLAIIGCGKEDAAGTSPTAAVVAPATPDGVIVAAAKNLKAGNIDALIQSALPPEEYAKVKADWAKEMNETPASDEEKAKFAENMTKLTASDAEDKLWAELEPKLKEMDAQMAQQMPMMVAMGKGVIQSSIQQNQDLNDAQKQQASQFVDALGNWVQSAKFTDPELAKKSIKIVCDTARKINLKTLDEARALSYEQAMQKIGVGFLGLKDVLALYGFSIDKTLDSIKAETVSSDAATAKVKVSYTVFDTALTAESDLVKVGDRWYGKEMMDSLKKHKEGAAAPAAPAEGETAPAPASNG
ncbi:hypothetical protein [Tahibacter amnicola]|uniref:Uncharacterized protein n=1 Tax=Tahibacter amnicola TaxID=2976241 RepID=A0ABY6BIZ5_9GAMM|nr:hypothetical protein [Tahibacter amnicola]UXI68591.1 hypothetical protein N4264_02760 [Tahibacter amnicola]